MKRHTRLRWVLLLVLVAILAGQVVAQAQTGGGYDLTWSTIDGGGYTFSTGGGYSLGGTIGQPDAGLLAGGDYTLSGGFWSIPPWRAMYLPTVVKQSL